VVQSRPAALRFNVAMQETPPSEIRVMAVVRSEDHLNEYRLDHALLCWRSSIRSDRSDTNISSYLFGKGKLTQSQSQHPERIADLLHGSTP